MSVQYNGKHSIDIWALGLGSVNGVYRSINTWEDYKLVPLSRPYINRPEPHVTFEQMPGTNERVYLSGWMKEDRVYGMREGEWEFQLVPQAQRIPMVKERIMAILLGITTWRQDPYDFEEQGIDSATLESTENKILESIFPSKEYLPDFPSVIYGYNINGNDHLEYRFIIGDTVADSSIADAIQKEFNLIDKYVEKVNDNRYYYFYRKCIFPVSSDVSSMYRRIVNELNGQLAYVYLTDERGFTWEYEKGRLSVDKIDPSDGLTKLTVGYSLYPSPIPFGGGGLGYRVVWYDYNGVALGTEWVAFGERPTIYDQPDNPVGSPDDYNNAPEDGSAPDDPVKCNRHHVKKGFTWEFPDIVFPGIVMPPMDMIDRSLSFVRMSNIMSTEGAQEYTKATGIDVNTFAGCGRLSAVSFPVCETIQKSAFSNCWSLSAVSFPVCEEIGSNAFINCRSLSAVSFPMCKTISSQAFMNCSKLSAVSFPACETIESYVFARCSSLSAVDFPACRLIGKSVFYSCSILSAASFPACESISSYAFRGCSSLSAVSFPACKTISNEVFRSCSSLSAVSFPACETIGDYAFMDCQSLSVVSFQACETIGAGAFRSCSSLSVVKFSVCKEVGHAAFYDCISLSAAYFPACISIATEAFCECSSLQKVSFPVCESIGYHVFAMCISLSIASFPACETIGDAAFAGCHSLSAVYFYNCKTIGSGVFNDCSSLESVYFLGSSVPSARYYTFEYSPISNSAYLTPNRYGSIFVPESLVEAYKTAENWSYYSSRITAYIPSS